jgi:L-alanine-DL-glutamate epimerase-like enolase superfamily enzyme
MVGWLNYDDREVQSVCAQAVQQGFRAVKIKVGYPTLAEDIRRIKVVREAIGEHVRLMVDANQSLTVKEAVTRGRAFQDLGCWWWEEPIPAGDLDGYAQLADALDIPIATGENLYTPADFARFLRRGAVDIVQPDLRRAGGPTGLLQIGALAQSFGIPYASHGGGPVQLNVMACLPNAQYLETGLITPGSRLVLDNGYALLPQGPGFDWEL